jgi:hypothetical protein
MIINNISEWKYDTPPKNNYRIILGDFGENGLAIVKWCETVDDSGIWATIIYSLKESVRQNDFYLFDAYKSNDINIFFINNPIRWADITPTTKEKKGIKNEF